MWRLGYVPHAYLLEGKKYPKRNYYCLELTWKNHAKGSNSTKSFHPKMGDAYIIKIYRIKYHFKNSKQLNKILNLKLTGFGVN